MIHVRGAMVYNQDNKLVVKKQNKNKTSRRDVPIMMDQLFNALKAVEDKTGRVVNVAMRKIYTHVSKLDIKNSQNDMAKFYNCNFTNEITNA